MFVKRKSGLKYTAALNTIVPEWSDNVKKIAYILNKYVPNFMERFEYASDNLSKIDVPDEEAWCDFFNATCHKVVLGEEKPFEKRQNDMLISILQRLGIWYDMDEEDKKEIERTKIDNQDLAVLHDALLWEFGLPIPYIITHGGDWYSERYILVPELPGEKKLDLTDTKTFEDLKWYSKLYYEFEDQMTNEEKDACTYIGGMDKCIQTLDRLFRKTYNKWREWMKKNWFFLSKDEEKFKEAYWLVVNPYESPHYWLKTREGTFTFDTLEELNKKLKELNLPLFQ